MGKKLFGKVFMLGVILLALCLGLFMVNNLVKERQQYRETVVSDFAKGLAGRQTIGTPQLLMHCKDTWRESVDGKIKNREQSFYMEATAEQAKITTANVISPRTRGIYQVNTYLSKSTIEASWGKRQFVREGGSVDANVHANAAQAVEVAAAGVTKGGRGDIQTVCGQMQLVIGVQDVRGIRSVVAKINGEDYPTEIGVIPRGAKGVHVLTRHAQVKLSENFKVTIELDLVGIESLDIRPHAASNVVLMQGNWQHPSFMGALPDKRTITGSGFEAMWSIAAHPLANRSGDEGERISVAFVDPVNAYTQTDRAIKYGLLFIVLTFVAVGLFEVTKKLQVHPVQYLLVGSAVSIFFLLLLSLSEHLSFASAYVLAATACVGLLTFYTSHILGGFLRGTPFGALIAALYSMIYVLLRLEQTALLIGTLALFATLTAVMVLTRKINWYELGKGDVGKG